MLAYFTTRGQLEIRHAAIQKKSTPITFTSEKKYDKKKFIKSANSPVAIKGRPYN